MTRRNRLWWIAVGLFWIAVAVRHLIRGESFWATAQAALGIGSLVFAVSAKGPIAV